MARKRNDLSKTTFEQPPDARRRAFLTLAAPAAGAAGLAAALARPNDAAARMATPQPQDDDGGEATLHRQAYYRCARF